MKTKKVFNNTFAMSFFATLLIIIVFSILILIAYRVENVINIEPIVVFSLTDHCDGNFSFTFFHLKGKFSLNWLYKTGAIINEAQIVVPAKVKTFCQLVSYSIDYTSDLISKIVF